MSEISFHPVGDFPGPASNFDLAARVLGRVQVPFQKLTGGESGRVILTRLSQLRSLAGASEEILVNVSDPLQEYDDLILASADTFKMQGALQSLGKLIAPRERFVLGVEQGGTQTASLPDFSLSIRQPEGGIAFRSSEKEIRFVLFQVAPSDAPAPPAFAPGKLSVPESPRNLRQRAEWFKRRSGH